MTATPAAFFPVIVTHRDDHEDFDHDNCRQFDQAAIRIAPARDLQPGDRVLASFGFTGAGRMHRADHFVDTYPAAPVPLNPDCGCPGHDIPAGTEERPVVVVTDGFPWDMCDVWDADAPALIVSARRPNLAELVALQPASSTAHDQDPGAPANAVRHPVCGGPMFHVDGPYRCVQCWATLDGRTRTAPGFEWQIEAGWLVTVETVDADDCADCDEGEVCEACEAADRPLPRMLPVLR